MVHKQLSTLLLPFCIWRILTYVQDWIRRFAETQKLVSNSLLLIPLVLKLRLPAYSMTDELLEKWVWLLLTESFIVLVVALTFRTHVGAHTISIGSHWLGSLMVSLRLKVVAEHHGTTTEVGKLVRTIEWELLMHCHLRQWKLGLTILHIEHILAEGILELLVDSFIKVLVFWNLLILLHVSAMEAVMQTILEAVNYMLSHAFNVGIPVVVAFSLIESALLLHLLLELHKRALLLHALHQVELNTGLELGNILGIGEWNFVF